MASCLNWSPRHCLFSSISKVGLWKAGYSFAPSFKNASLPKNGDEESLRSLLPVVPTAALTSVLLYHADLVTLFGSALGPPGTVLHQGLHPSCHFSQILYSLGFFVHCWALLVHLPTHSSRSWYIELSNQCLMKEWTITLHLRLDRSKNNKMESFKWSDLPIFIYKYNSTLWSLGYIRTLQAHISLKHCPNIVFVLI